MTAALKQASNNTNLSLTRELSPNVVDGTVTWAGVAPNSYKDFGAQYKMVARNPINAGRQMKKGVITDLDSTGGWQEDMTYEAMQNKVEGLFYADFRKKADIATTQCATSDDHYAVASSAGVGSGDLIFVSGFVNAANNGLKHVASVSAAAILVTENIVDESGATYGKISRVGFKFANGDVTYTASTKTLASTAKDFTTLGMIAGEWMYCADDTAGNNLGNNLALARVYSIAAHAIVFDKVVALDPTQPIVDAAGTGKTAQLYFAARILKNEVGAAIRHYTYQAERTLGLDDTAAVGAQAEYVTGAVIDQGQFVFNTADKATVDWTLMGSRYETRTSAQGTKPGMRPTLLESSAFNTSTDVRRMSIELVGSDVPLYAYVMDCSITVKNNNKANKAIGVLGSIDHTEGNFGVKAAVTAYFANVAAATAISGNKNVTLDVFVARDQHGIIFDLPLVTLGDGRPKITANEAIQLPLDIDAATAASINAATDYTMMLCFFDYLPALATP